MSARSKSLFARLLSGFALVLVVVWAGALANVVYYANNDMVRHVSDENRAHTRKLMIGALALKANAADITAFIDANEKLLMELHGQPQPGANFRLFVWKGGQLLYGTPGVAVPPLPAPGTQAPFQDGWVAHVNHDGSHGLAIMRYERFESDWMFTPQGAGYLFTPLVYSLPFMLLPAWFIVRRGLQPLHRIVGAIEQRTPCDLAPLPATSYRELAPLIEAVNRLMDRLSERLAREQQFLTDAAHELKTPLSVIQLNAHLLAISDEPQEKQEARAGLTLGVARATHTVHQLLALERVLCESGDAPLDVHDLKGLLCDRLALAAPLALARGIDIVLHAEHACALPLHRESMAALLDNLIGNAIKYSPDHGKIHVTLAVGADATQLRIVDQGPGIPDGMQRRVFERFYRAPGQEQSGSGLGLAIAERAALRNKATIRLARGDDGRGLLVVVTLPPVQDTARGISP